MSSPLHLLIQSKKGITWDAFSKTKEENVSPRKGTLIFQKQKPKMFHQWEENWFFKDKSKKYFVHERKIVFSTIKTEDVSSWIICGWIENRPFFVLLIIQVSHSIKQTFSLSKAIENFLFSPFLSFFIKQTWFITCP